MRPAHALAVAAAVLVSLASTPEAVAAEPTQLLAIELTVTDGTDDTDDTDDDKGRLQPWQATALRELIGLEAARDRRIELATSDAVPTLTLTGRLGAEELELWVSGGPRPAHARIRTVETDRRRLRRALRALLDDALRPLADGERDAAPAAIGATAAAGASSALILVLILVLILALPFAIGAWLLGRANLALLLHTRSFPRALAIAGAALVASLAVIALGDLLRNLSAGLLIAGGLAWGWFAVVSLRVIFPTLPGFERVEHGDVFRLTRAWSLVALQRLFRAAAFYAPFALLLWLACHVLEISDEVALAILAPVWGLIARFWLLALVELASLYLDREFVPGERTEQEPWHQAVRGYFMGYVRRAGWPASDALLDDILFLPGLGSELHLYGGGLTHSRIIIGKDLLEYALAPYGRPHDYAGPRISKLHWSEWNAGLVVPLTLKGTIATPEDRQPRHSTVPGETDWEPLGQPPTLAGFVEPDQFDKRGAHRPFEDPVWLEWDAGDEHDGTDASDKDFVFGALVRELGAIRRQDDQIATLGHALRRRLKTGPALARASHARASLWIHRAFSRYPAIIGDAYAALNYARHHLIQYLAWRTWEREDLLTARAYAPELEGQSNHILRELDAQTEPCANQRDGNPGSTTPDSSSGATAARRMAWLSEFFRKPKRSRRTAIARRMALGGALLLFAVVCALGIKRAVDYHPTYVDRFEEPGQETQDSHHEQD